MTIGNLWILSFLLARAVRSTFYRTCFLTYKVDQVRQIATIGIIMNGLRVGSYMLFMSTQRRTGSFRDLNMVMKWDNDEINLYLDDRSNTNSQEQRESKDRRIPQVSPAIRRSGASSIKRTLSTTGRNERIREKERVKWPTKRMDDIQHRWKQVEIPEWLTIFPKRERQEKEIRWNR